MNKAVLTLAIFAFCLFPQVLSDNMRVDNDRKLLGTISGPINLGNIGNLFGGLVGVLKNTTNTTSPTNTTVPVSNTTTPVQNNTSTTVPANNTSPVDTPTPVNNSTSTNTTSPVNTTVPANTTAPVDNSTSPVNNSTSSNNTASIPADNTTQPSDNNSTTNSTTPVDSGNTTTPVEPTPAPVDPTPAPAPIDTNWYARNDVDRAAFKQKCLDIHNILRGAVGVAPLTWSDSLAASAQDWANNMAVYGFRHSGRTGENIASTTSSAKVTVRLLGLWTHEQDWFIKGCVYPKCSSTGAEVGHYTQMVWAKTTQVGCGFAPGVNKQWNYLCCQYYRAGNVIGQTVFPYPY